ncbi:hypothetical protein [Streptomyces sp. CB03911]|uniref:hypothetical protein n=1 Tax=Streptomyces sp. CB03911 TaxID=1804758 RepID=UPI00093E0983|nr:hypothetical protein [Streptomyces sp. CB03911]OKI19315.1 hypothetical protein A6A07_07380 [Streptomyces sp. CB03911]
MALFTAAELALYLQRPVTDEAYGLVHELTEDAIRGEVGSRLTDPPQSGVKSVAITAAGRALTNPGGLRSATAGAVAETYRDGQDGVSLTTSEIRRLRRAVGMSSGAGMLDIGPADEAPCTGMRRVW